MSRLVTGLDTRLKGDGCTVVWAGNWQEFVNWCQEQGKKVADQGLIPVTDANQVIRYSARIGRAANLVCVGTWNEQHNTNFIAANLYSSNPTIYKRVFGV